MYTSIPLFWSRIYGKNYYLHLCISRLPQLLVQNVTYTQVFTVSLNIISYRYMYTYNMYMVFFLNVNGVGGCWNHLMGKELLDVM